jgi:hypothetical protein
MPRYVKTNIYLVICFAICFECVAQEATNATNDSHSLIKYSGIWLSGKLEDAEHHFPVGKTHTLSFKKDSNNELSKKILSQIRQEAVPGKGRLIDCVAPDDYRPEVASGRAYVLACSINYEHIDCDEIGGVYKVMGEVGFDLVICDFTTRSVIVCLPGRLFYKDISKHPTVSDEQQKSILNIIYTEMLPKEFIKLCKAHGPEIIGLDSAGVSNVKLFEEAMAVLPDHLKDRYEFYFSNVAASNFYEATGMPLMPYSRGNELVFSGMQENLVDASNSAINTEEGANSQKFILKKPRYNVELTIPAFRTNVATSNEVGKAVQICTYSRITIKQGDGIFYSSQHDASKLNTIPKDCSARTPWLAYSDSLNEMFFNAGKKIKASISGKEKKLDSPLLVIQPSKVKSMFADCAPWTLIKNK